MNKNYIIFGLVTLLLLSLAVAADEMKLSVSSSGPFNVGDEFDITVYYKPDGTKTVDRIGFRIVDAPKVAGAPVATDGILFVSGTSQKILSKGATAPTANDALGNGDWNYFEFSDVNAIGCSTRFPDEPTCVGIVNQYNEIMKVRARVTAVPATGTITLTLANVVAHNFDTDSGFVPNLTYVSNQISFNRGATPPACTPLEPTACVNGVGCPGSIVRPATGCTADPAGVARTCNADNVCVVPPPPPGGCTANAWVCNDQTSKKQCNAAGDGFGAVTACAPGETCSGSAVCAAPAGARTKEQLRTQMKANVDQIVDAIPNDAAVPQNKESSTFLSFISSWARSIKELFQ